MADIDLDALEEIIKVSDCTMCNRKKKKKRKKRIKREKKIKEHRIVNISIL